MQASLCLCCHQKGQSCIPLWSRPCLPVCYLHRSNTDDAIWQGKPGSWSGGEPVMLLQKINRLQLDKVPELAESVELPQAQGRQRRCGGRSSPLKSQRIRAVFLCAAAPLHHLTAGTALWQLWECPSNDDLLVTPDRSTWFLREISVVVTLRYQHEVVSHSKVLRNANWHKWKSRDWN